MTKFRTSILICGCIVLCVIGALVAFLTLSASGMIVSDPIEISVRVDDNRKEYDGTPLSAESYRVTSGELLKGHELQITFVGSQTAVGASAGTADIKVTDAKKRDVSKQYVFTVTPCLLEVTQRTVSFVQENVTREYTGGGVAGGNTSEAYPARLPENRPASMPSNTVPIKQDKNRGTPALFLRCAVVAMLYDPPL